VKEESRKERLYSMGFSAVIFDMDGLMFDTERISREAWDRAMADCGYAIPDAVYLTVLGRTMQTTKSIFKRALGPQLPIEAIYQSKERYLAEIMDRRGLPFKPGLLELLAQLEIWRIPKAVASSTARGKVLRRLALAGVDRRFAAIVCGDDVPKGKPSPDLFVAAARLLGARAEECVVLEDADAGIRAASTAGMIPVMVPDLQPPTAQSRRLAYRIVPSLREARDVLAELRGADGRPAAVSPRI
jgi:HAD superfamily hydrolase (TIGR01509 family)